MPALREPYEKFLMKINGFMFPERKILDDCAQRVHVQRTERN